MGDLGELSRQALGSYREKLSITEVSFQNENTHFQNLISRAREKVADGTPLEPSELEELENYAWETGDTLTQDEYLFLESLRISTVTNDNNNIALLRSSDFDPASFTMELDTSSLTNTRVGTNPILMQTPNTENPFSARIRDVGTGLQTASNNFNLGMLRSIESITLRRFESKPEIRELMVDLLSGLTESGATDLERYQALLLINEMTQNRVPPLSDQQITQVFEQLNTMLSTDYDYRVGNNKDLVLSALHDISIPSNIDQIDIGTCGGACVQIQLALRDPVKYVQMLDALSSNQSFEVSEGNVIEPNWTFFYEAESGIQSNRSISSMIMQNAIMDFANGDKIAFDSSSSNEEVNGGLTGEEVQNVLNSIFGQNNVIYSTQDYTPSQLVQILRNAEPSRENPIQIGISYSDNGRDAFHAVNIIGIEGNNVTMINPWGREETYDIGYLETRMFDMVAPPNLATNIPRISDNELQDIYDRNDFLNPTDEISNVINRNGQSFLNRLSMDQKVEVLTQMYRGITTEADEQAILRVLLHTITNNQGQSSQSINSLAEGLENNGIDLLDLLDQVNNGSRMFYQAALNIFEAFGNFSPEIAALIVDGSRVSNELLMGASDQTIANLAMASSTEPDILDNSPRVTARMIEVMYQSYSDAVAENYQDQADSSAIYLRSIWDNLSGSNLNQVVNELNRIDPQIARVVPTIELPEIEEE